MNAQAGHTVKSEPPKNRGGLSPVLSDGPFTSPSGPAKSNFKLWLLMLPQGLIYFAWDWPAAFSSALTISAGALIGCFLLAPGRRRALGSLDWFINAWLVAMLSAPSPRPLDGFFQGLCCGLITAVSGHSRFLTLPGSTALAALGLSFICSQFKWLMASPPHWLPDFNWRSPSLPEIFIIAGAFLVFSKGANSKKAYALPCLSGLAGLFIYYLLWHYTRLDPESLQAKKFCARAAAMLLPSLLIAPGLARSKMELAFYELVFVVLFFFLPLPQPRSVFLNLETAPFWAALPLAPLPLIRKALGNKKPRMISAEASGLKAYLKCGHQGTAAGLADWLGPPSCRLANKHDDGDLLCPYGCLGFGDCARVCPTGALSFRKRTAVIDRKLCLGCGRCREACPKGLISLTGEQVRAFIPCASESGLKRSADYCAYSCLGCSRCAKACPAGAISRKGSRGALEVDQIKCSGYGEACGQACLEACPRSIITAI